MQTIRRVAHAGKKIGFLYSSTGRNKDVFTMEFDLSKMAPKARKRFVDRAFKLWDSVGGFGLEKGD